MHRVARRAILTSSPSLSSRLIRRACIAYYRARGWRLEGAVPEIPKFIIVGAPHTSNWDFVIFLAATDELGVRPSFVGKHSLFRWPMTRLMYDMGGIPVDRTKRANYTEQVAAAFAARDELALVIAPEGTRDTDGHWRSGFYHIAMAAGVPIVPAWLNLGQRLLKVGEPVAPTGDYRADIRRIADFYRACEPDNTRFAEIDREEVIVPALPKAPAKPLGERA